MHTVNPHVVFYLLTSNCRDKSVLTIPYFSNIIYCLISLSTKVDPAKNPTSI